MITIGIFEEFTYFFASSGSVKSSYFAVGTPADSMIDLAKDFEVSILAASLVGPIIGKLFISKKSTIPAANGISEPTIVKSIL